MAIRKKTDDGSVWKYGKTSSGKKYVAYRGADGTKGTTVVRGKDSSGYLITDKKYTSGRNSTGMKYTQKVHPVTGKTVSTPNNKTKKS